MFKSYSDPAETKEQTIMGTKASEYNTDYKLRMVLLHLE